MDCNRDEAARAMIIAEQKLKENDIAGAKEFAYKAKSMYYDLEGIERMLCTIDVLLVLARTEDRYEILSIDRSADPIASRKRYLKSLQLHPDKNKLPGAEDAFKSVNETYKHIIGQGKTNLMGQSTSKGETQESSSKARTSNPATSPEPACGHAASLTVLPAPNPWSANATPLPSYGHQREGVRILFHLWTSSNLVWDKPASWPPLANLLLLGAACDDSRLFADL
ncbi:hypothetical protein C2845_PM09G13190 [Panicum miliaceum]|uniref:J domain-containing protein n=1 Tax=Panicum miliaceum TaxID=4540 RepID=A0A3L6S3V0_PANMI|nr:hypothetical protein C2845_PM09G13190 [Panicum miliaceum]